LDPRAAPVNVNLKRPRGGQRRTIDMSSATMDISIEQLRRLPLEKRLELIDALWDSDVEQALHERWPIPRDVIDDSHREIEAHLADPNSSIPWETVWARLLERYGFHFDVVYAQAIDAGELKDRYDVLILTDDARLDARDGSEADRVPQEYRHMTGALTTARSLPRLKQFIENGGTLIAEGQSTSIAADLGLPISISLVDGKGAGARQLNPEQ
jgi:hypothetical protein